MIFIQQIIFTEIISDILYLQPELYLCTPIKVDFTRSYYVTAFEPNATMETAHHMLVYGCTEPGSAKPVWSCGEMAQDRNMHDTGPPCSKGSQVTIQ